MATQAKVSRGEAFGRRMASYVRWVESAERELSAKIGPEKYWIKFAWIFLKAAMIVSLGMLMLWILIAISPIIVIVWAMVVAAEESETVRIRYNDGTTSADHPPPSPPSYATEDSFRKPPSGD